MFSFKNIKLTYKEKIKNADDKSEMALGIAEVAGKSVLAGATALVYHSPYLIKSMLADKIKDGNQHINNENLSDEQMERFYEFEDRANDTISIISEKQSTHGHLFEFLSNKAFEEKERENLRINIEGKESNIEKLEKKLQELENNSKELSDKIQLISNNVNTDEIVELQQQISDNTDKISQINKDIQQEMLELERLYNRQKEYDAM